MLTTAQTVAILNAYSRAQAAQILGMTVGSVRVLCVRLRRLGWTVEHKRGGRVPKYTAPD